jgi:hypothetical protein
VKVTVRQQPRDPVTNEPIDDRPDVTIEAPRVAVQYRRSGCDRPPMIGVLAGRDGGGWGKAQWFDATETVLIIEQGG